VLTVIAGALGWRGAFVVLSGLALVIALILSSILRREEKTGGSQFSLADISSAYRLILRDQSSLILVVAASLENTGVNVMWTYYGAFYVQQHGFGVDQIGWVSLAAGLGVLLGQTAAGTRLGGRPKILFIVGCAGSGSLIGLSVMLAIPPSAAITLMAIGWLLHGLVMVSTVVLLVGQSPAGRATTLTFYGSAMSLGMAMGAVLGGLALSVAGFFALGVCTLILPMASVVILSFRPPAVAAVAPPST
jgi:MFS transporter, DHA1 family, inner membrane transport protein